MTVSIGNLRATWSNSSIDYIGLGLNVNSTVYGTESSLFRISLNNVEKLKLAANGLFYISGNLISSNVTITGGNTDISYVSNVANSAYNIAVAAFNTANAGGGGVSSLAFDKANSANVLAYNTGIGTNTYLLATIAGANTAVGTGANSFTSATIAGANTAVGTGANAFATSATAGANAYMIAVQNGSNTAVGTGANAFTSATIAGANAAVGTGANAFTSATIAGANTITTAAFNKANNALANTSGVTFAGNLLITSNVGIGEGLIIPNNGLQVSKPATQQYARVASYTANTMLNVGFADLVAFANNGTHYTQLGHNSGGGGFLYFAGNNDSRIMTTTATKLYLATNSLDRMTIDSSGRVTKPYQPMFHASLSSGDKSAAQYVKFNTVNYNVGSHYDTSTGYFTAPVSGYYAFMCTCLSIDGGTTEIALYKNGASILGGGRTYGAAYAAAPTASAIIYLAVNDSAAIYLATGSIWGGGVYSYFSGYLLG